MLYIRLAWNCSYSTSNPYGDKAIVFLFTENVNNINKITFPKAVISEYSLPFSYPSTGSLLLQNWIPQRQNLVMHLCHVWYEKYHNVFKVETKLSLPKQLVRKNVTPILCFWANILMYIFMRLSTTLCGNLKKTNKNTLFETKAEADLYRDSLLTGYP